MSRKKKNQLSTRIGRPSGLTPELRVDLIARFSRNVSVSAVAGETGIAVPTLYRWLKAGEEGDPLYSDVYLAREKARSEGVIEMLDVVRDIAVARDGQSSLNAAKKWLAWYGGDEFREQPKETNVTVTAKVDEDRERMHRALAIMTPEQLRALEAGDDEDVIDVEVVDATHED